MYLKKKLNLYKKIVVLTGINGTYIKLPVTRVKNTCTNIETIWIFKF